MREANDITVWKDLRSDGPALDCAFLKPLTVSCEGVFGGALVTMEGRVGKKWFPIVDQDGGILSFADEGMGHIHGEYPYIRPRIEDGSGATSITVSVYCEIIPKRRLGK